MREDITEESTKIKKMIRDAYGKLYANKFDNLDDMDEFLDRYKLPRIMKEQIDNLNIISIKEIKFIV